MKKSAFLAPSALLLVLLSGCPIYDGADAECFSDLDCDYGAVCDGQTNSCVSLTSSEQGCSQPSDCLGNETCSRFGTCKSADCSFASVGCVGGYECRPDSGLWECVKPGATGGTTGSGGQPSTGNAGEAGSGDEPSSAGQPSNGGAG